MGLRDKLKHMTLSELLTYEYWSEAFEKDFGQQWYSTIQGILCLFHAGLDALCITHYIFISEEGEILPTGARRTVLVVLTAARVSLALFYSTLFIFSVGNQFANIPAPLIIYFSLAIVIVETLYLILYSIYTTIGLLTLQYGFNAYSSTVYIYIITFLHLWMGLHGIYLSRDARFAHSQSYDIDTYHIEGAPYEDDPIYNPPVDLPMGFQGPLQQAFTAFHDAECESPTEPSNEEPTYDDYETQSLPDCDANFAIEFEANEGNAPGPSGNPTGELLQFRMDKVGRADTMAVESSSSNPNLHWRRERDSPAGIIVTPYNDRPQKEAQRPQNRPELVVNAHPLALWRGMEFHNPSKPNANLYLTVPFLCSLVLLATVPWSPTWLSYVVKVKHW